MLLVILANVILIVFSNGDVDPGAIDILSVKARQNHRGQNVSEMQQAYRQQVTTRLSCLTLFFRYQNVPKMFFFTFPLTVSFSLFLIKYSVFAVFPDGVVVHYSCKETMAAIGHWRT